MPSDDLFTRDEALGGLPAGRARTLLFLIESRTAHLVARSRQAMELAVGDVAARERDLAFLEAFTLGREPPLRPSMQDLERYAPQWADLVPANPRLCAALAHLLGEKYVFTRQAVPGIRAVLGLDTEPVQQVVGSIPTGGSTCTGRRTRVARAVTHGLPSGHASGPKCPDPCLRRGCAVSS